MNARKEIRDHLLAIRMRYWLDIARCPLQPGSELQRHIKSPRQEGDIRFHDVILRPLNRPRRFPRSRACVLGFPAKGIARLPRFSICPDKACPELFSIPIHFPTPLRLVAAAVQWADRIMRKIDVAAHQKTRFFDHAPV
jgi:hypothetical protein